MRVAASRMREGIVLDSMQQQNKPLLLLDVDGVLIPYAAPEQPPGFLQYTLLGEVVWLSPDHGALLRPLADRFQLMWATSWEHDANRLIAPIVGLPVLPVIEFPRDASGRFPKFPTIERLVANQPLVWIDDELTPTIHAWALRRRIPTLLIDVDPAIGLTQDIVARIMGFPAAR